MERYVSFVSSLKLLQYLLFTIYTLKTCYKALFKLNSSLKKDLNNTRRIKLIYSVINALLSSYFFLKNKIYCLIVNQILPFAHTLSLTKLSSLLHSLTALSMCILYSSPFSSAQNPQASSGSLSFCSRYGPLLGLNAVLGGRCTCALIKFRIISTH